MLRCAFIVIAEGVMPKTYSAVYKNDDCHCIVAGVSNVQMGKKYVKKLVDNDFTVINLCSEFSDGTTRVLQAEAGEGVKIRNAQYSFDEVIKLSRIDRFRNFGLIIKLPGVEKAQERVMRSDALDTRVIFVGNIRQARNAGRRLIQKRIEVAELSTWFDRLRMDSVVDAMEDRIPVGTCGDLNMRELED